MTDRRQDNLGYWCHAAARANPDRIALIDLSPAAPREIRYQELEDRLDRFAALMDRAGLKPGDRLAMSIGNRFEFVEVMYGAMRAGIVPVPLNTRLAGDTLAYILENSESVAAVVDPASSPAIVQVCDAARLKVRFALAPAPAGWRDYESSLLATPANFAPPALPANHMSFLPYTSGSTGRPKGVVLTHEGQLWWIRALQKYWPSGVDDRALAAVPLFHKNAMAGAIKPLLHCGGSVVLLPGFEARRFLEVLSKYRCTAAGGVPAVFTLLLQQKDLIASLDFSALKSLKIGSAPTPRELMDAVEAAFGVPVNESYGLTEGGPVMIGAPRDGRRAPHGSCGVIWPEGECKLVSADGADHPSYGELWVRNPGVTPGYYKRPQVNRERLVDGWLRTGDVFSLDAQGFYYFRGRVDDMFNSGGENVYPLEVENILLKHPAVAECSVVPFPHAIKGEVPVAMVVMATSRQANEDELKKFCLANGPAYAHPRRIHFVAQLPLNGPGKIDRKLVTKQMREIIGDQPLGG